MKRIESHYDDEEAYYEEDLEEDAAPTDLEHAGNQTEEGGLRELDGIPASYERTCCEPRLLPHCCFCTGSHRWTGQR